MRHQDYVWATGGLVLLATLLAACGGENSSPTDPDGPPASAQDPAVTISPSADTLVAVDAERDFSADIVRSDGTSAPDTDASWSSSDTTVVTVGGDGRATARSEGTVSIAAAYQGAADTAQLVVAPEVDRMVVSPPADSIDALGGRTSYSADARDANGHTVAGVDVGWSSSDSSVATVDSSGTVTGRMPGEADIVASATGVADTARVRVVDPDGDQAPIAAIDSPATGANFAPGDSVALRGSATDLEDGAITGADLEWSSDRDGQLGTGEDVTTSSLSTGSHVITLTATDSQGQTGTDSVSVTVQQNADLQLDRLQVYRRGVLTSEVVEAGGVVYNTGGTASGSFDWEVRLDGTVVSSGTVSDLAPGDSVRLGPANLGTVSEGRHEVELSVDVGDQVTESDESDNTGWDRVVGYTSGFAIELDYVSTIDSTHRAAFESAAARWEEVVRSDLPDVTFSSPYDFSSCADSAGTRSDPIDDMLIFVRVDSIDGPGGTLGQAGPCTARYDSEAGHFLTASAGRMTFDEADLDRLATNGELEPVVLHEMGHVLGIGTLWRSSSHDLRADAGTNDPYYTGAAGRRGFSNVGGDAYSGTPIPLANTGGSGTADSHWRESVFEDELMTGYLSGTSNPLSEVTVRSLGDQYYAVDPGTADSYQLPTGSALRTAGSSSTIELGDDLIDLQVRGLDDRGNVVHVGPAPGDVPRRR